LSGIIILVPVLLGTKRTGVDDQFRKVFLQSLTGVDILGAKFFGLAKTPDISESLKLHPFAPFRCAASTYLLQIICWFYYRRPEAMDRMNGPRWTFERVLLMSVYVTYLLGTLSRFWNISFGVNLFRRASCSLSGGWLLDVQHKCIGYYEIWWMIYHVVFLRYWSLRTSYLLLKCYLVSISSRVWLYIKTKCIDGGEDVEY